MVNAGRVTMRTGGADDPRSSLAPTVRLDGGGLQRGSLSRRCGRERPTVARAHQRDLGLPMAQRDTVATPTSFHEPAHEHRVVAQTQPRERRAPGRAGRAVWRFAPPMGEPR